jgi:hypothetical protein
MCSVAARYCSMSPPAERARARDEIALMTRRCASRPPNSFRPGDRHDQDHTRPEQSPRPRDLRHAIQYARLCCRRAVLVTRYIQHSAHIGPGREGLFDLIRSAPAALGHEDQLIAAEGDFVIAHGRFSGNGRPRPGLSLTSSASKTASSRALGVLQDEATKAESVSGLPMSAIASRRIGSRAQMS